MIGLIFLSSVLVLVVLFCFVDIHAENKGAATWHLIATGLFDRAEYETYYTTRRSGAMVHHSTTSRGVVMAVSFTDGRAYEINDRCDVPFPRYTMIDIMENANGRRKVVEHKE